MAPHSGSRPSLRSRGNGPGSQAPRRRRLGALIEAPMPPPVDSALLAVLQGLLAEGDHAPGVETTGNRTQTMWNPCS